MITLPWSKWSKPFETLREKWVEVPASGAGRMKTTELLRLPDEDLLALWERCRAEITIGAGFNDRGWYHTLYAPQMSGKKLLDVGSGLGFDSITYAQSGARVTFVDLAESNLAVLKRLCGILGLQAGFRLLTDLDSLCSLDSDYDVIMAIGSLHHAPIDVIKPECREFLRHLKIGGRWLQLAYPQARWIREGKPSFSKWGELTDGQGTPWAEWYDVPKLLDLLAPAQFDVVLYKEFHESDFNWFDLIRRA